MLVPTCCFLGGRDAGSEAADRQLQDIRHHFSYYIKAGVLRVDRVFVTPDNIFQLMGEEEYDLLIIDIDGNDYYIWEAVQSRPRVVMIEYNALCAAVQEYAAQPFWSGEFFRRSQPGGS